MRTVWQRLVIVAFSAWAGGPAVFAVETSSTVVVYYFHRTARCHTCLAMEEWTRKVAEAQAAARGQNPVVFAAVNLDQPENEHNVDDFQITFNTVVLAEIKGGTVVRWKNLAEVWTFCQDEAAFRRYVETELATFLASCGEEASAAAREEQRRRRTPIT